MSFWIKKMFMQQAGDGAGGGGGDGDAAPDPKMVALINSVVHKALSERDSRLEKKLVATMNTAIGGKFDEIRQLLVDSDDDPKESDPKTPGQDQQPRPSAMSPEDRALMKKAQADAADAKRRADEWENKAKQEAERNRKAEERQLLQSGLAGRVKPAFLDMAIDQLHQKHVTRDEETGSILWKDADGTLIPAKDGIAAWLKSEMGKEFAPPRDARGSGSRGGEDIPTRPGAMTLEGVGDIVNQAMSRNR